MVERTAVGFLRNGGEILLLKRAASADRFAEQWTGVTADIDSEPQTSLETAIRTTTGIDPGTCELHRRGEPVEMRGEDSNSDTLLPFLYDCPTRAVTLGDEHADCEWTTPAEIRRRETVPGLWAAYDAVRPTVETIRNDREHGSAYISVRALEVVRDEGTLLAMEQSATTDSDSEFDIISAVGEALLDARPSMTVIANRVNRAMQALDEGPAAVAKKAHEELQSAWKADEHAAENLASRIEDERIGTLSRSGTVLTALEKAGPPAVLLSESRPGREGVDVAETLATETAVTLTTDAAFPGKLSEWGADALVVGADAIMPDGSVRNKVGTRPAVAVANTADIPVYVVAAVDKISPERESLTETRPPEELYDGPAPIAVENPVFEPTPESDIDAVVTERGSLDSEEIRVVAEANARRARWREE